MAVLQSVWCTIVMILALYSILAVSTIPSVSPSQDLIFGVVGQQWSSQARAGVGDALDDINNNTELLSDYKLKYFQDTHGSEVSD